MKLRTRLDLVSAALLSALGASQVVACGGTALVSDGGGGGSNGGAVGHNGGSAGSIASAGAAHAGASSGGATGNQFPCKNPMDTGDGVIQCDGFTHRPKATTCTSKVPRPEPFANPSPEAQCKQDSDCTQHPYGWCGNGDGGQIPGPYCIYGCVKDSDCGDQQLCLCGDPVGRCALAVCHSDAECAAGFLCKGYDSSAGCGITTYTCQSAADTCGSDADCHGDTNVCLFDVNQQHFSCQFGGCAIGRPFLVEGEQRLAPVAARADWSELSLLPRLDALDAALSAQLAEQWTRVALMEHASIAAFARFTLQLLSLGAAPELIERATAAMADETKHAKACFAVANCYSATRIGPGRLAVDSSLDEMSLTDIVLNTIREGCIGETVAAIEAGEAAEHCADPALRELLLVVSQDETRHAELAFRFVKWALSQGDARLEQAVRGEFAALTREPAATRCELGKTERALLRHGIVPEGMRRLIRARAIREVILPCSNALYATETRPARRGVTSNGLQALGGSST